MTIQDKRQPGPIWEEALRYCPRRSFPLYRFTPGSNPHPRGNPKGHSYGLPEEAPSYLPPDRWQENETYLFGIDLYHQGYLWESHEAWESLWHLTQKEDGEGQFLQGLIQNAAAQLKLHLAEWSGARHLSREAYRRLNFAFNRVILDHEERFMGIAFPDLLQQISLHYQLLWKGEDKMVGNAPRLILHT